MCENPTPQQYRAEISEQTQEILRLNKLLSDRESSPDRNRGRDKFDPFSNPTDYSGFSGDYSKIVPEIESPDYDMPLDPDVQEKSRLKKYYATGGCCILLHTALSYGGYMIMSEILAYLLHGSNPDASMYDVYDYMNMTSIYSALNMLVFLIVNLFVTFIGFRLSRIKPIQMIRTRDFSLSDGLKYCIMGFAVWYAGVYLGSQISDIISQYGFVTSPPDDELYSSTVLGMVMSTVYGCIIAPITEEMLFRGMLLRVFSRANQRFAVFATAFFFAVGHRNIQQAVMAFLMGIFLAHITLVHGSVIPSIIVHIFINTIASVMGELSQANEYVIFILDMTISMGLILGVILLIVFRSGGDRLPTPTPFQSRRGLDVACTSWFFMIAFVEEIAMMVMTFVGLNS